jgi:hypothetical protein
MTKWISVSAIVALAAAQSFHDPVLPWHFEQCDRACGLYSSRKETIARFGEERLCEQFRLTYVSYCQWVAAYDTGKLACTANWEQHRQTRCVRK